MVQFFCDISLFVDVNFLLLFLIPFYRLVSFSSYFDFIHFIFFILLRVLYSFLLIL